MQPCSDSAGGKRPHTGFSPIAPMALCPTRMKMNPFSSDRKLSGKCPVKKTQKTNKCKYKIPRLISPRTSTSDFYIPITIF